MHFFFIKIFEEKENTCRKRVFQIGFEECLETEWILYNQWQAWKPLVKIYKQL